MLQIGDIVIVKSSSGIPATISGIWTLKLVKY